MIILWFRCNNYHGDDNFPDNAAGRETAAAVEEVMFPCRDDVKRKGGTFP